MRAQDLTPSADDRTVLRAFYENLYVSEFPDADERESLINIERYLELKARGWYGPNNYHVVVFFDDRGRCVAGSIFDYLAGPNAGVIEFLVVDPRQRGRGFGARVRDATEAMIAEDARRHTSVPLACVIAEINDPCQTVSVGDSIDPFVRARIWSRWGYHRLDFPYIQPALSPTQRPVRHLLLAIKPLQPEYQRRVPAPLVAHILREYMRWAMRIPEPETAAEYAEMGAVLDVSSTVTVAPITRVIRARESRPLVVREVVGSHDPDLEPVRAVYRAAFPNPALAVPADTLSRNPHVEPLKDQVDRHLWSVRAESGGPVCGMVSFFTFRKIGFGGYVALTAPLRGRGFLRSLLARVEDQMVRDCRAVRGWLIECAESETAARFQRVGFHEVPVPYRQPPLDKAACVGPLLQLLYREIGTDGEAELYGHDLLDALAWVFRAVYGLEKPRTDRLFEQVERAVRAWPHESLRWSAPAEC